ncbi:MAG: hypothetical protein ACJA2M_002943 [Polaribacter sp.]|jgi:hypothetical protein
MRTEHPGLARLKVLFNHDSIELPVRFTCALKNNNAIDVETAKIRNHLLFLSKGKISSVDFENHENNQFKNE